MLKTLLKNLRQSDDKSDLLVTFLQLTVLLLFIMIGAISCKGQMKVDTSTPKTKASNVAKSDVVLHDKIWKIYQDQKDHYWFGSDGGGVYQYDGAVLKQYTTKEGLISNQIRGIQEDPSGNIYIETPEGVSKYDGTNITSLKVIRSSKVGWKMADTDLWFSCNSNNLYRYDGKWLYELRLPKQDLTTIGRSLDIPSLYSPYSVFGIDKDRDGNIWFGTSEAGAFRYDGDSFLWIGEPELSTLSDGRVPGVRSMIQDKDGYYWLSNFYSKYELDPAVPKGYHRIKAVDLPAAIADDNLLYFNSGLSDKDGNLWMSLYGEGLWKYNGQTITRQELGSGAKELLIVSIYEDNNGVLWLGTNNDGVYKQTGDQFVKFEVGY